MNIIKRLRDKKRFEKIKKEVERIREGILKK